MPAGKPYFTYRAVCGLNVVVGCPMDFPGHTYYGGGEGTPEDN